MSQLYGPLAADSIRLLTLHDDTGLSADLETYDLRSVPPFVALSYTWEDPYRRVARSGQKHAITINREEVPVHQNLYDALTTLAELVGYCQGCDRRIWIDAICINQSDVQERNSQVRLMKDIYVQATVTLAWLGMPVDIERAKLGVGLMRTIQQHVDTELDKPHDDDGLTVFERTTTDSPGFALSEDIEAWTAWQGIEEMMGGSYWSRTWVYQEATAPGYVMFCYGTCLFPFDSLRITLEYAKVLSWKCPRFDTTFPIVTHGQGHVNMLRKARVARESNKQRNLLSLVKEVHRSKCSNGRDKIYATLGQAAEVESAQIAVDYSKDVRTVFKDFVRFEMTKPSGASLRILESVQTPAPDATGLQRESLDSDWPSWVPDWRQHVFTAPFPFDEEGEPVLAHPCPGSKIHVFFDDDVLSIEGFALHESTITSLTSICEHPKELIATTKVWYSVMTQEDQSATNDRSVRRSLVVDTDEFRKKGSNITHVTRGGIVEWDIMVPRVTTLFWRMIPTCSYRRMGKTLGGFIGIFPAAAQLGDFVAAFHGGHVLYLLRLVPSRIGHYRFIGTCYLDGFMDGEAVRPRHKTKDASPNLSSMVIALTLLLQALNGHHLSIVEDLYYAWFVSKYIPLYRRSQQMRGPSLT